MPEKEMPPDEESRHSTTITLSELIQVAGVILGSLSGFVFADTARARIVTALITCATVLACGVIYSLAVKKVEWRSPRIALSTLASVIIVVGAASYAHYPARATGSLGPSGGGTPVPFIQKTGYVLRPSSSPFTNDEDKVDLDTGCPGWGDIYPHLGPFRCGHLADLIIDPDSLHTADGQPNIIAVPQGIIGAYSSCRALLTATPNSGVNSIQSSSLWGGEVLCVKTNIGNTALVHLDKVTTDDTGQVTSVTIDFQVWKT